ncbi:hypothetical protein Zmor_019172 [Zophobas morio]|uniref:Uncharacterized protein n=1 Tax=Zophobas morio TaxID=2755281 RepID=A0AA38M8F8_9CUCU|nr:hypothetical protein Zmor_019172 [Zophobas morio]
MEPKVTWILAEISIAPPATSSGRVSPPPVPHDSVHCWVHVAFHVSTALSRLDPRFCSKLIKIDILEHNGTSPALVNVCKLKFYGRRWRKKQPNCLDPSITADGEDQHLHSPPRSLIFCWRRLRNSPDGQKWNGLDGLGRRRWKVESETDLEDGIPG